MYISTRSCLDYYRSEYCPHKGHKLTYGSGHVPNGILAVCILLHMGKFGLVPKYRLYLGYRVMVIVPVADNLKAPGRKPSCLMRTHSGPPLSVPV